MLDIGLEIKTRNYKRGKASKLKVEQGKYFLNIFALSLHISLRQKLTHTHTHTNANNKPENQEKKTWCPSIGSFVPFDKKLLRK